MYVIAFMCSAPPTATDPPSPAAVRAWVRLMRAQRLVLAAIERDLKDADLPPLSWYDVLWELARAEDGRLRPFEIEERTLLAQYNLSRLLNRLEHNRLIHREPFSGDGRGHWVVITDAGRTLRARMWTVYAEAIRREIGDRLSEAEAEELAGLLSRLAATS